MITIPFLARLGQWGGDRIKPDRVDMADLMNLQQPTPSNAHHALVIGYGRVGELVGQMLEKQNLTYIAADTSAHNVTEGRDQGKPVYFGDASRKEYLRQCGIMDIKVLIVTIGSSKVVNAVVSAAKELSS
jgi:monovalent cation:H+ antiporter-2, CPA2 family